MASWSHHPGTSYSAFGANARRHQREGFGMLARNAAASKGEQTQPPMPAVADSCANAGTRSAMAWAMASSRCSRCSSQLVGTVRQRVGAG